MRHIFSLAVLVLLLLSALASPARAAFGEASKLDLSATTDVSSLPPGASGNIAVVVNMAPDWHIQSDKPHDESLIATQLTFTQDASLVTDAPQFPLPLELPNPDPTPNAPKTIAVYEDRIVILVPFTIPQDAKPGPLAIKGKLYSQACNADNCIAPASTNFTLHMTLSAPGTAPVKQNEELFAAARKQKFPVPATGPATPPPASHPATVVAVIPPDHTKPGNVVNLLSDDQQIAIIKERPYKPYNQKDYPLAEIMLFALIGGAILNIMPCVLPVIPLKVLGLVQQAHGDRRLSILHGLTFSAGIITLFVALAVFLKVVGLFYGQQFQSPTLLITMAFLVLALALSMIGVWTIQTPQTVYKVATPHAGFLGSFSSGLLVTLLATPCSAPYLGPVLGWALLQPAWITAIALGLVGVGMSLPYLILAAFPVLLSRIPKAGRWSELLKQGLGIVMIGVGVYLITLLPNASYWPYVFFGAVILGLVCWAWGQIPTGAMELSTVWTIRAVALVLGLGAGVGIYYWAITTVQTPTKAETVAGWTPFNVALLDDALKSGHPVVVDWGASWCINCKVLEATVLHSDAVEAAFRNSGAVLLRADETILNPPTTALNEKLGGKAIPVLAIFTPARPYNPVVLRDNYSKETVITELQKAVAGAP